VRSTSLPLKPYPGPQPPSRSPPAPGGAIGGVVCVAPDLIPAREPGALLMAQGEEGHPPPEPALASSLTLPIGDASLRPPAPSSSERNRSR
jgi:hypothetical protein